MGKLNPPMVEKFMPLFSVANLKASGVNAERGEDGAQAEGGPGETTESEKQFLDEFAR